MILCLASGKSLFPMDHFSRTTKRYACGAFYPAAMMVVSASLLAQTSPPAAKPGVPPTPTCVVRWSRRNRCRWQSAEIGSGLTDA